MDKESIKAEILNLSASILMGKAKEDEIKRVTKLACDNDLGPYLRDEFQSIGRTLNL